MSNLKDELERLEIPHQLRARAKQGIEQAAAEKSTVKKSWLPTFLTGAITAAAIFFVFWAVIEPSTIGGTQGSTVKSNHRTHSYLPYGLALIVTILYIAAAFIVRKKQPALQKKWLILAGFVTASWSWNVAYFDTEQLQERKVLPIWIETLEGSNAIFYVQFVLNKSEEMVDIKNLVINGVELEALDYQENDSESFTPWYSSFQFQYELSHQVAKMAMFDLSADEIAKMMRAKKTAANYIVFTDGEIAPIEVKKFDYVKTLDNEVVQRDSLHFANWSMGSNSGESGTKFELNDETKILAIQYPQDDGIVESYELLVGTTVIKRVNYNNLEDVDLLPYTIPQKTVLHLNYSTTHPKHSFTYHTGGIIIEGEKYRYFDNFHNQMIWSEKMRDYLEEVKQHAGQ